MGFLFRASRLLSLLSNAGKQPKPICFFSKGRSGLSGKANIEGCFIVSRGDMGMLFWRKRHPRGGMPLEQFDVTHVRPSNWPPPVQISGIDPDCFQERVRALGEPKQKKWRTPVGHRH